MARILDLIERLANLARAEERRLGAADALQPVHVHALAYLQACNRYSDTPAAVAEHLGVTKGTASQTIRRLQDRGLVTATTDAHDRRRVRLALTARGTRTLREVHPPPAMVAALGRIPGEDRARAEAFLEALLRETQAATGNRTFGVCKTCRHFVEKSRGARSTAVCGLTGEALATPETEKICREHEPRE
jgi:MarR family transcriptional repressor of emrRAB